MCFHVCMSVAVAQFTDKVDPMYFFLFQTSKLSADGGHLVFYNLSKQIPITRLARRLILVSKWLSTWIFMIFLDL